MLIIIYLLQPISSKISSRLHLVDDKELSLKS